MTELWQEEYGLPYYRVKTTDRRIYEKLMTAKNFRLNAWATNADFWIFVCEFKRPDIAKKVLMSKTGVFPQKQEDGSFLFDPTFIRGKQKKAAYKEENADKPTLFD